MISWIKKSQLFIPLVISFLFTFLYSLLSIVRFDHYDALGFDLGVIDQIVWKYSHFSPPISTIHFYPFQSLLADHVELIYAPISVFYWVFNSPKTLLVIEPLIFCLSGIAIYLLAKEKKLNKYLCFVLLFSYLTFYGVQNALWFNIHGVSFGASFIAWFIYFTEKRRFKFALLFFLLAICSKENIASLTFLISFYYFITRRKKEDLLFMILSIMYLFFIFFIYFPYFTLDGYRFKNGDGLTSNILHISSFYDSSDKRSVIFYTLAWFGFIPLLNPLILIPTLGDLWNYFVIASNLKAAQGLFLHYRVTLAPLMTWATILTIYKFNFLKKWYVYVLLLLCPLFLQYYLHLPLSYLSKRWFWNEPQAVKNINKILSNLPQSASVVSQNNITPHISHRDRIFTLWPEKKSFSKNSPCGKDLCDWFRWVDTPEYLIVDTSSDWDIRHLLTNREEYIKGLDNLEKTGIIKRYKQVGNSLLYKIKQ